MKTIPTYYQIGPTIANFRAMKTTYTL